jgi:uncharacterized protein
MELNSTRLVPAPVDAVWSALNDPAVLKECVPGCESLERDGEHAFQAQMTARVGPVSAKFSGRMTLADIDPPHGYTLRFEGQGGAAGFANGEARVALAPADGGTSMSYAVRAQVGGKLAQIGSRLVDGAAAKLADDFFARFTAHFAAAPDATPAPAPAAEVAAAAEARSPGPRSPMTRWIAIAAIVGVLAYLFFHGRAG